MARRRSKPLAARAQPALRKAVGDGRRGRLLDDALGRLPLVRWPSVDVTGWTSSEFLDHLERPPGALPVRRAGRETVGQINAMAGLLPAEGVLLARAITDTAPPAGESVHPTLRSVLDSYLPESLRAYAASHTRGPNPGAEELLLAQLRLLHQVAVQAHRADAHDNHTDLRIQDAFLRERFAQLSPNALTLPDPAFPPPTGQPPDDHRRGPAAVASPVNPHADVDSNPVVRFAGGHSAGKLTFRLAIPKGHPTTLGAVVQTHDGAVSFRHTSSRRWLAPRRPTGFPTAQADLPLSIDLAGVRRLLVFARAPARAQPTHCVLFVRDTTGARTAMPTLLAGRRDAAVTVICSGYAAPDGMVLRNESTLFPDLREACTRFGYDSITWLDPNTPIV